MANNWAIAIGINQYHFFQPLGCAQADAEALKDFLVTEGGFSAQKCILLTDTSPPFGDRPTVPTKDNILLLLKDLIAACCQPRDRLWFFFSGYGVNYKGQDYLMPVEGSPDRVEETGIEVQSLLQSLQAAELNTLILLDINRAFGSQGYILVGEETIKLAQELQVPTIISCQPQQFSHESSELGHGFFMAALLEALRSGNGSSLAQLERYLSLRTPELCQHHWRPIQNPVAVITAREPAILPQYEVQKQNEDTASIFNLDEMVLTAVKAPAVKQDEEDSNSDGEGDTIIPQSSATLPESKTNNQRPTTKNFQYKSVGNSPYWQMFLLWGATTMLLICLIVAVFFRNQAGLRVEQKASASPETTISDTPTPGVSSTPSTPTSENEASNPQSQRNQALLNLAKMSLKQTQASELGLAIATARKIKAGEPLYEQAQENIKIWSGMILDLAEIRAKQKQYASAIAAAQLISKEEQLYSKAQSAIKQWQVQAKEYVSNKTVLDAANGLIRPEQASSYNRAIEVAKKIPSGEPGFEDAQKSIDQWSQKIFDISMRHAFKGELKTAVETAALVPEGTEAYKKAQKAIQKWQKK
ncbi:caspase family protein [Aetokthonos hydrillicola Thurmond2011]|jgi:uncharacterized caspase-like protein|uniref:Caspase family protein n=1 Tax=Aetokthonos hydrillicola Thurmond2011 TaxID=2712845 RepID=A0AAP5M832_9CYAN|nr:caspase family protein [Aetokthonos hydrillicola]MBW4586867.1 caspase family protein [Aetokthonos hydrillicola CCALA 1050]MDR9895775.1 caspase family protein [Aetokthonos hydrillicola Thurmond2011]